MKHPCALLFVISVLAVASAAGQEAPAAETSPSAPTATAAEDPLLLILVDHVKPSKVVQYETALRGMVAKLAEHEVDPARFTMRVASMNDLRYVFAVELAGFGGVETLFSDWAGFAEKVGEPWARLDGELMAAIDHSDISLVKRRSDLSYEPAEPRVASTDVGHVHYDFYYLAPGHSAALEEVAKSYVALFESKGVGDGFTVYQTVIGPELPMYVISQTSKGLVDYYAADEERRAAVGSEMGPLQMRALATLRRLESAEARPRPDLSYP